MSHKKAEMTPVKIAVVGIGSVGSTTAYTLLLSGLVTEIVLIDINKERTEGECMDLNHAAPLTTESRVYRGEYSDCSGASIVIVTGGANQKPGQTRMELASKNVSIMEDIIPNVAKNAPDAILVIATNPVDVLTYASYKLSGFPASRVIGSGTLLDSARLKYHLGQYFDLSSESINAYVVGEHGDSELPVWSLAAIAGMRLQEYCNTTNQKYDTEALDGIFEDTKNAAYNIIKLKGCTDFGIAAGLTRIVEAILRDEGSLLTVSTVGDYYGVNDVALSLPTKIGRTGAQHVVKLALDEKELKQIKESGQKIKSNINELHI